MDGLRSALDRMAVHALMASAGRVSKRRAEIGGLRITHQEPVLRHFTARFEPV